MLTVAAALHRRALTSASARRRPARAVPPADLPTSQIRAYTAHLHGLVNELDSATREAFNAVGLRWDSRASRVRRDAAADGDDGPTLLPADAQRILARIRAAASKAMLSPSVLRAVDGVSAGVVVFTREQFAKQLRASLGIDLTSDLVLTTQRAGFQRENVALIRSLTAEHVERVASVLHAGAGERVETIRARIMEQTGAVKSRASLIARDQVLSLNSQITQARHQAAGIMEYVWRTSHDERVRERHRELDGKRFRYDDPPVVDPKRGRRAHAGQDFQCRCVCEPVLPDFSTLAPAQPGAAPPRGSLPGP